jgi:fatty-acyl-CoA synthase
VTTAVARATEREAIERRVLDVVSRLAGELGTLPARGAAAPGDALDRDLGFGSLERVELALRLEQVFAVRVGDAVVAETERCHDLVDAVMAASPVTERPHPSVVVPAGSGVVPLAARTLTEALGWHAERASERVHIVLRHDDGSEEPITYGVLWARAAAVAAALHARHIRAGDTVAIMLRTEPAFFAVFFGILLAGAVPVPIYPPFRASRLEEYASRQAGILRNAEARLLVTFREAAGVARLLRRRVPSLEAVVPADTLMAVAAPPPAPPTDADLVALIQYTSGSTGDPKGVVLTHANLLANVRALGEALAIGPDDVCVSWLPLYHDMGLIGAWLGSLYHGIPVVLLSPLAFLGRPARWLTTLAAHRGTLSPAPNFAFDLCVKRVTDDEMAGVDLAAWRLALNGSEPVSADSIERFTRRFARWGFRPQAMAPVYGLAEASVGLTTPPPGRGPRIDTVDRDAFERRRQAPSAPKDAPMPLRFVSCGRPLPGHDVRIVDAAGRVLAERTEGRIEFRGPSVTAGYHRKPELTHAAVRAGWMDSGDLGYWADGELFVTGRSKDLIIKAGRNLYPQEIEDVVGGVPGIRRGCVAAFGVADPALGTERLVVIAESRATEPAVRERLRAAVVERIVDALGLPPDTVVVAPPGVVLKTSSGKVRRSATKSAYLAGTLARHQRSPWRQWARLRAGDARLVVAAAGHAVWAGVFLVWTGLLLGVTVPPLWIAIVLAPRGRRTDAVVRRWCKTVLRLAGYGPAVHGLEHLPAGPAILVPNHSSYLDVVALLAALPIDLRFLAKRELLTTPIVGTILRKVGHLAVERADFARSVVDAKQVAATLESGVSVCVFPEGTFVDRPGLLPFRLGAFKAAVETGCPVVPVGIRGTRQVLPGDTWRPRPGRITVAVAPPLRAAGEGWREMVRLRDAARAAISAASGERS